MLINRWKKEKEKEKSAESTQRGLDSSMNNSASAVKLSYDSTKKKKRKGGKEGRLNKITFYSKDCYFLGSIYSKYLFICQMYFSQESGVC